MAVSPSGTSSRSVAVKLLYTSMSDLFERNVAFTAVQAAIGERAGDWWVSLIEPPRQRLCVIVVDGPNGFTRSWTFDSEDRAFATIRRAVETRLKECDAFDGSI